LSPDGPRSGLASPRRQGTSVGAPSRRCRQPSRAAPPLSTPTMAARNTPCAHRTALSPWPALNRPIIAQPPRRRHALLPARRRSLPPRRCSPHREPCPQSAVIARATTAAQGGRRPPPPLPPPPMLTAFSRQCPRAVARGGRRGWEGSLAAALMEPLVARGSDTGG
jgi:hypothetical protein